MIVEIRLYKSHDTDLVALCNAGYCISNMLKEAIIAYANGTPMHFIVDEFIPFEVSGTKSVRTRFTMPDSEVKACYILRNIKKGYRNSFCKAILRNALVQQNLNCYFTDPNLVQLQSINLQYKNVYSLTNVVPCSSMKLSEKQIEFLGKKIKRERPKPIKDTYTPYAGGNPFTNMNMGFIDTTGASIGNPKKKPIQHTPVVNSYASPVYAPDPLPQVISVPEPQSVPEPIIEEPKLATAPPVVDINELTSRATSVGVKTAPTYNNETIHTVSATEIQDDVVIGVADDDELLKMFEGL